MAHPNLRLEASGRAGLRRQKALHFKQLSDLFRFSWWTEDHSWQFLYHVSEHAFLRHLSGPPPNRSAPHRGLMAPGAKCLSPGRVLPPILDDCCRRKKNQVRRVFPCPPGSMPCRSTKRGIVIALLLKALRQRSLESQVHAVCPGIVRGSS